MAVEPELGLVMGTRMIALKILSILFSFRTDVVLGGVLWTYQQANMNGKALIDIIFADNILMTMLCHLYTFVKYVRRVRAEFLNHTIMASNMVTGEKSISHRAYCSLVA